MLTQEKVCERIESREERVGNEKFNATARENATEQISAMQCGVEGAMRGDGSAPARENATEQ